MGYTDEEIIQNKNNMLIAEFMGAEILSKKSKFSYVQYPLDAWVTDIGAHRETYKQKIHSKKLEYHESYNWIMAVIEKIETIVSRLTIKTYTLANTYTVSIIVNDDTSFNLESYENKHFCIYQSCINFIEWYNENKK